MMLRSGMQVHLCFGLSLRAVLGVAQLVLRVQAMSTKLVALSLKLLLLVVSMV